jgi:hypothetical protein
MNLLHPYTTSRGWRPRPLFRFAMLAMAPAARAEFLQREPVWIVPLVFLRVIVALLTLGARQRDEHAISFFGHFLRLDVQRLVTRAHGGDRTHDLTLTKGVLYH